MEKKVLIFVTVLLTLQLGIAIPQPPGGGGPPRWDRERVETVIIGKFAEELDLSPQQAEKFFPRFKQFRRDAEGNRDAQHASREMLDRISHGAGGDQAEVPRLLDEQQQLVAKLAELRRVFLADVSNYLTPQQVSRCALLMEDIPRRMRELVDQQRGSGPPERGRPGRRMQRD
ncbi:periplasmic heavy metal sensor [candidate division KSB1 bacterium]|nr:periplasmic heavy metal sensor [candidate division KSB1 bacterium]